MNIRAGMMVCCSYIGGLLLAGMAFPTGGWVEVGWVGVAIALLLSGGLSAAILPRVWRRGPGAQVWLIMGLVAAIALGYSHWRVPQPGPTDVSQLLQGLDQPTTVVQGYIDSDPRLTRSQTVRFSLRPTAVLIDQTENGDSAPAPDGETAETQPPSVMNQSHSTTGKLYVTVPLLKGTGLYVGQRVQVRGRLYLPEAPTNPGAFDFRAYLARQGIFAGLRGQTVEAIPIGPQPQPSLLGQMRQRIVRSLVRGLGGSNGALLSAMVLGRQAVDLSFDVRDAFTQAGLAHTIAASGFHVSLLLGVVLTLTRQRSPRTRLLVGTGVLLVYIGLTGIQPSVVRAGAMGFGALLGATLERKTRPVGLLLVTATLMLLINPGWIWNLGFQLSFLATLGLLVTAPVLSRHLDWLPTSIASLIAIPVAAYGWTVPLQMYSFGVVPTYSIGLNVLATPLIVLVSLGGMVSGAIALLIPPLGSGLASLLGLPMTLLRWGVDGFNQLPGSSLTTGILAPWQVAVIYGLFGLIWWQSQRRMVGWMVGLAMLSLVAVPVWYGQTQTQAITVLDTDDAPTLVVQDRGTTGLVFGGTDADAAFTLLPFLRQQGIRHLDWAIALHSTDPDTGWPQVQHAIPMSAAYLVQSPQAPTATLTATPSSLSQNRIFPLTPGQQMVVQGHQLQYLAADPTVLTVTVADQRWLLVVPHPESAIPATLTTVPLSPTDMVWWAGLPDAALLQQVTPQVLIQAAARGENGAAPAQASLLRASDSGETTTPQIYDLGTSGALRWMPGHSISPMIEADPSGVDGEWL